MNSATIAFIGAGNMGAALISGLVANGYPPDKLWAVDPHEEKLNVLASRFGIHTTQTVSTLPTVDVLIFAVKPHSFKEAAEELRPYLKITPLIISIAAGIREEFIKKCLGANLAIVRAMPNTPALIGCGATALFANALVSASNRELVENILRAVGVIVWVDQESHLDIVTALSGSGPAYFFMVMEILQEAAQQLGLEEKTARLLTLQTALGASRMAIESGKSLEELRQHVTSKGGTTEKALQSLENQGLRNLFHHAIYAAKLRAEEMSTEVEDKNG